MKNTSFLQLPESIAEKYKLSAFNIYCDNKVGLVYNTYTENIVAFENKQICEKDITELVETGFLVDKSVDEISILEDEYNNRDKEVKSFHVIIAVTLDCQCRCFYCYENHPKIYISDDVGKALVQLAEKKARSGLDVSVVWYGGEPLLAFDKIVALTREFKEICAKNNVTYTSTMISNGYAFDEGKIDLLDELDISEVQITLDGVKEVHDKRRPIKEDRKSFERIFSNVCKINKNTNTRVKLRINVDKNNIKNAYELIDYCADNKLQSIDVTLGMLKDFGCGHNCSGCKNLKFSMLEFSDEFLKFKKYLKLKGFETAYEKMYPVGKLNSCTIDAPDAYVIGPDGEFYKCISQVGDKSHSIGNVLEGFDEMAHLKYSPFSNDDCKKCSCLPICMGACLYNTQEKVHQQCDVWKYITDKTINEYYL